MARGSGLNLVGAICKQGSLFVITSLLAVKLGKVDLGRYAECYALLTLLGLLSLAGLRSGLTRFIAIHLANADPARVRGTVRFGLALTLAASACLGGVLVLSSGVVAGWFHDPHLRLPIVMVGLTLPASAFQDAALAAAQGWRRQKEFALIGLIFDPLSRLALTAVAVFTGMGLTGAMSALLISSWAGALLAGMSVQRRMQSVPQAAALIEARRILSFSMISWLSALASTGLIWADTLILGVLSTQHNVGVYTVAARLVTLAVFVMAPINAAFTPHIAHFSHLGDKVGMSRAYGDANRWIMRLSMPAFIVLIVFPQDLLGFFKVQHGAAVTAILAIGQMVSSAAGPCGSLLNMSGRVMLNMVDNVAALVVNVVLNLWLIPLYGIVGASLAWSASLTLVNVVRAVQVRLILGVRSADAAWTKTFVAALPAAAAAGFVAWLTSGWVAAILLGLGAVTLVYVGALLLVGIGEQDTAIARSMFRSLRNVGR